MYKIEAVVIMNGHDALVLDKDPEITYERHDEFLFGLDEHGVFANSYGYESPGPTWKAFGGRKFNIPMTDGTVIEASGQWWDKGIHEFEEALGCNIIPATIRTKEELKNCYVFCGCLAVEEEYRKLRESYTGKIYEYRELKKLESESGV